jgi:hypothetical protein
LRLALSSRIIRIGPLEDRSRILFQKVPNLIQDPDEGYNILKLLL